MYPPQNWPIAGGRVTFLAMLSPGLNKLAIRRQGLPSPATGKRPAESDYVLSLTYIPLTQTPPLHLAVLVAQDSPGYMDCPPVKRGTTFSAHTNLTAAADKLRMMAHMWQAATAEAMREAGFGRRAFRLQDKWGLDTSSSAFLLDSREEDAMADEGAMRGRPVVHFLFSKMTMKELMEESVVHEDETAADRDRRMYEIFLCHIKEKRLAGHGERPVIAGLIFDAHWSRSKGMLVGPSPVTKHRRDGASLAMFGSETAYSWPRCMEEVVECLTDTRVPEDDFARGKDRSLGERCAASQSSLLRDVMRAFGLPLGDNDGFVGNWTNYFLAKEATEMSSKEGYSANAGGDSSNRGQDLFHCCLSAQALPHFWRPGDKRIPSSVMPMQPDCRASWLNSPELSWKESDDDDERSLEISCAAGLARILFNGDVDGSAGAPSVWSPVRTRVYTLEELESRFDPLKPLEVTIYGMNARAEKVSDVWPLLRADETGVRIPGSRAVLTKPPAVTVDASSREGEFWSWATLLSAKSPDGSIKHASRIDVRTGCVLDGMYVHYEGLEAPASCGPLWRNENRSQPHRFGGHAAEEFAIPDGAEIVKIELAKLNEGMKGLRIHFSDGTAHGALSGENNLDQLEIVALEPGDVERERIVGFFGKSHWPANWHSEIVEFGIITAPRAVALALPEAAYELKELRNTDGTA